MFPVFNNFSETHCMKVGLDVRISFVRVLSTGRRAGGKLPPNVPSPPKKFFLKKIKSYFKY